MASNYLQRLVTSLPLTALWTDAGPLKAERVRHLPPDDLQLCMMVQQSALPLVVADCGKPLHWVERSEYREFWWREATPHLATLDRLAGQEFCGDHCYIASEWSTECGGPVIVLEMHRRGTSLPHNGKPAISCQSQEQDGLECGSSRIDRDFYLGIYRYAVRRYKPIIEERTGVQLGDIQVKSISELHSDVAARMERAAPRRGLLGFLRRRHIKKQSQLIADRIVGGIHPSWYAVYSSQSIYVAFTVGTQAHEDWVVQGTVHELAHRLWEKLGGHSASWGWQRVPRLQKLRLASEGFAVYAERTWFRDFYCSSLRKKLASDHLDETHYYVRGFRAVEEVVKRLGPDVLLKLPRQWEKLMVLGDDDVRSAF